MEIDFCGHATLATAYTLHNFYCPEAEEITFHTRKVGDLDISITADGFNMNFPAYTPREVPVTEEMTRAIGTTPLAAYLDRDLLLILNSADEVRKIHINEEAALKVPGLILAVTAPGDNGYDCVSRAFGPKAGVLEDPVTGSTHCMIAPYWAKRLGKRTIRCPQASARGGEMTATVNNDRVTLQAQAVLYSRGDILTD